MANIWKIPSAVELEVRARDLHCVYCGVLLVPAVRRGEPRKNLATWEHIVNDLTLVTPKNIVLACSPCNSSKGRKLLAEWLKSPYCASRGITEHTVAAVVQAALQPRTDLNTGALRLVRSPGIGGQDTGG